MEFVYEENQINPGAKLRERLGLISQEELADMLEVTRETLREWRRLKQGPDYVRVGKSVFYRESDIHDWMKRNAVTVG